jgi:hypothetical protein
MTRVLNFGSKTRQKMGAGSRSEKNVADPELDPEPDPEPASIKTFCSIHIRIRNSRLWIQIRPRIRNWT